MNYRNKTEILDSALTLVPNFEFEDGDDDPSRPERMMKVPRKGDPVELVTFATPDEHNEAFVAAIQTAVEHESIQPGDILVAVTDNHQVGVFRSLLEAVGIPTGDLRGYDGTIQETVEVGTFLRSKGLEFKWVFIPRLDLLQSRLDDTDLDRSDRLRRQLFVAMTRARDEFWVGSVDAGTQAPVAK